MKKTNTKAAIYHADFLRVSKSQKLRTNVPLHFVNEATCKGVKMQGGAIIHAITELEISCLPADLPEYLEVDLAEAEIGQTIHISDIALPKGVESVALSQGSDHDSAVAKVIKPKGMAEEDSGSADSEDSAE